MIMAEIIPNIPDGLIGAMTAWLTHRVYQVESRLEDIATQVGAQPRKRRSMKLPLMLVLAAGALVASSGCTTLKQKAIIRETSTNGTVTVRELENRALTAGHGAQVLEKLRLSAGKTAAIGLEGLEQVSSNSASATLDSLGRLLQALPK